MYKSEINTNLIKKSDIVVIENATILAVRRYNFKNKREITTKVAYKKYKQKKIDMKSSLYTRTGDDGTTSLVGGERAKKNCARLEAYGTIDELSTFLGAVVSDIRCDSELQGQIREIQNEMFNIGAYLATQPASGTRPACASLTDEKMKQLEGWIDALDEQTPKINAFVLPGGSELASKAHTARVVCRRAERRIMDLSDEEYVDPKVGAYINRLSDYLFIAARYINFMRGVNEVVW